MKKAVLTPSIMILLVDFWVHFGPFESRFRIGEPGANVGGTGPQRNRNGKLSLKFA